MIDCDCIREILLGWYLALQLMLMLVTKETLAAVRMHMDPGSELFFGF